MMLWQGNAKAVMKSGRTIMSSQSDVNSSSTSPQNQLKACRKLSEIAFSIIRQTIVNRKILTRKINGQGLHFLTVDINLIKLNKNGQLSTKQPPGPLMISEKWMNC